MCREHVSVAGAHAQNFVDDQLTREVLASGSWLAWTSCITHVGKPFIAS